MVSMEPNVVCSIKLPVLVALDELLFHNTSKLCENLIFADRALSS